jgi:hypothetical protein
MSQALAKLFDISAAEAKNLKADTFRRAYINSVIRNPGKAGQLMRDNGVNRTNFRALKR